MLFSQHFDPRVFLISLTVIVLSVALHEFGHAFSADRLGDDTPRREGRVTLWPDRHWEPVGFTFMLLSLLVGRGLGWGKPVMVNTRNFRKPNRDMIIVTICGPLMNLLLALVFGMIIRFALMPNNPDAWSTTLFGEFAFTFLRINLGLMFFNLIPIPPLDGSKVLYGFLPFELAVKYERFMAQYSVIMLGLLIITGATSFISPAVVNSINLILGGQYYMVR